MKNKYRITLDIETEVNTILDKKIRESIPGDEVDLTFVSRARPAEYYRAYNVTGKLKSLKRKITKYEKIC